MRYKNIESKNGLEIAIIGLGCRLPDAETPNEFWENLLAEKESIAFFAQDELVENLPLEFLANHKNYIAASGYLDKPDYFDGAFFEFSNKEALLLDPQIRLFLECSWAALEDSGYADKMDKYRTGVFGTASDNMLWQMAASSSAKKLLSEYYQASILNNKDFLSTIVAYKLNLTGPSLNLSTACSSSLVAVHLACQNIISGNVDLALAGGACINFPFKQGYVYQDGMILSKDGHCRAFDNDASGTVGGNGGGVVLLKLLEKALEDNDHIYAIIKGSAVNNDGIRKVGFTAPSIDGQAEVIAEAHYMAEVDPESIGYIEAHGSGTQIGDQIEIEALKKAFHNSTKNYCGIGSVKTNIGHLDVAAGIAGLIKATLSLKYKKLIRSLNYKSPNERIHFEDSSFYVNDVTSDFMPIGKNPLRAGVSSFGISGTNAHLVLEESPAENVRNSDAEKYGLQLLLLSAMTEKSLNGIANSYKEYFENNDFAFSDAAHTTRTGRKYFGIRRCIACRNKNEAIEQLSVADFASGGSKIKNLEKQKKIFLLFSSNGDIISGNLPEKSKFVALLAEYTGSDCELIDTKNWETFKQIYQVKQNIIPVVVEVGNNAGFKTALDVLVQQNDDIEYIHIATGLSDTDLILKTSGALWERGLDIFWEKVYADTEYYIIPLPTYTFDKVQFTLKLDHIGSLKENFEEAESDNKDYAFFERTWENSSIASYTTQPCETVVLLADQSDVQVSLLKVMKESGHTVILVSEGDSFCRESDYQYRIRKNNFEDYVQLLYLLEKEKHNILTYIHLFSLSAEKEDRINSSGYDKIIDSSYYSLMHLSRALGYLETINKNEKNLFVISNNLQSVGGNEKILFENAALMGLIRNIPVEFPLINLRYIDFDTFSDNVNDGLIARQIEAEIIRPKSGSLLAYRGRKRYVETFRQIEEREKWAGSSEENKSRNVIFCGDDAFKEGCLLPVRSVLSGAKKGALTLVSRTLFSDIKAIEELKTDSLEVKTVQCDFYNKNELDSLLETLSHEKIDSIISVGLVKEEYLKFVLEAHDQQREETLIREKWTFALNLFHGAKNLDSQSVIFCLPGTLYTGKEGYGLQTSLIHAINGLCTYADCNTLANWRTLLYYPVTAGQDDNKKVPSLVLTGDGSTEIFLSKDNPNKVIEKSKNSYDVLFNKFLERKRPSDEVFYKPVWVEQENINIVSNFKEKSCILFIGDCAKGQMLEESFALQFNNMIIVREGDQFSKFDDKNYFIDSSKLEDYYELFDAIHPIMGLPDVIIHGFNFNDRNLFSPQDYNNDLDRGLYSLINIARSMGRFDAVTRTTICSITNNIIKILGSDIINPGKAPGLAAVKVIPFEYPALSCLNLDIDVENRNDLKEIINSVMLDIALASDYFTILAYRKGQRFIERFEQYTPAPKKNWKPVLREKGIYLITGGFGGMGFSIAEFLAKNYRARCVLVGRSPFPPVEEWQNYSGNNKKTAGFIKKILELESLGAEFLVVPIDITDINQVMALREKIKQQWDEPINGIIHTAGLIDYNGIIQNRSREMTAEAAAPKIEGTINLDQVFCNEKLDFLVLCSSIGDIIPASKVGEVGYCAGNEFADAYTHFKGDNGETAITINWNDWSEVGMSVDSHYKRFEGKDFVPEFDEPIATKPEEGVDAFNHVIHMNQRRLVISPYDLSALILKDVEMNYIRMTRNYLKPEEVGQNEFDESAAKLLSKTEAKMVEIYRDIFQAESIGIDDNFFDIGGDSLMAMSILSYIHMHFDVKLPVDKFFNQPTIWEVAGTIDSLSKKQFIKITKAAPKEFYPLSQAQERMFITDQIYKEMALTTYSEPHIVKIKGKVDISRVERAFMKIIERHESFRTSYHFYDNIPVQKIHDSIGFKVEILEIKNTSIESVIRDFIKPFNLAVPPLVRAGLIKVAENEWILIIDKHHITCDGLSNQILFQNFAQLYCENDLSEQTLQYVDFSEWYNHTYRERMQEENERFWLDLFKDGVPELKLPYDHIKTPNNVFRGAMLDFEFTSEQSEKMRSIFSGRDTTQFVIMLAVYSVFLARISGQRDFVIGSPVSGRWYKDVESIVGMFVNMLSFRVRLGEGCSFLDYLKEQKAHYLKVFENQYYPFDLLVKKVVKKREFLENPIFNVSLEQHSFNDADGDVANIVKDFIFELYQLPPEYITARFDLSLLFGEKDGNLAFRFIYAKALFDESTIMDYRRYFTDIFEKILENPNIQLSELLKPEISVLPEIKRQESSSRHIISYADVSSHQERLWFIDSFEANKLYEGSPVYHNIPALVSLDFVPDIHVLQKAVNVVFNKYDALCTTIQTQSYKPVQVISKPVFFPVQIRTAEFDENNKYELLTLLNKETQIPFVLDKSPLVRILLYTNSLNRSLLVVIAHHIICDNYSLRLLLQETVAAYQAEGTVMHDNKILQYFDYSYWQASIPENVKRQLLTFWEKNLAKKVKPLELYTDYPREDIHIYKAGFKTFTLPEDMGEKLKQVCFKDIDTATLFMAAFQALLYRYSGAVNITIGNMIDNRNKGLRESIFGPLAGLQTISVDITPGMTFEELVTVTADYLKCCEPYLDIPFESIVTYINPRKDMSRTALFDILFRYSDISGNKDTYPFLETNLGLGKYDMDLLIQKTDISFSGIIVYNALYYSGATIDQMVQHFIALLDQLFNSPEKDILAHPLITGKAKEAVLELQQNNKSGYPKNVTIFEAFKIQAEKAPDKAALSFNNRCLSYRDVMKHSVKLSNHLIELYKIKPGEKVALLMHNSEWMIIAILAILRAGACYLPINTENPADRIKYFMEDSMSNLLITDRNLNHKENKNESKFRNFNVKEYVDNPPSVPYHAAPPLDQTAPAYIIYTSGTTGNSKGCLVTHRNVIRLIQSDDLPFDFNQEDKWIMAHSYSFDFSVWEMFGSLLTGGELVIPSFKDVQDIERFVNIVKENKITVLNQTPGAFSAFMLVEKKLGEPELHQHLRYVLFGGAKLEPFLLQDWIKRYPLDHIAMCNLYGITETTVHTTYHFLREDEIIDGKAISNIGRALPETEVYILNDKLELVPRGVIGEIYVGGSGVSAGYLNRLELNRKVFIANPFHPEEILYKSGDLGRWISQNEIQYLGRKDRQVKVRGYRIELGEIESRLRDYQDINQVYLLQHKDTEKLCAYFVANQRLVAEDIRNYLSQYLPEYMIPSFYIQMEKIPLTLNNKIDIQAFPLPEDYYSSDEEFVLPRNETEEKISDIIRKLLKIKKISVFDNYFDMGVDSLLLIQMNSRIEEELGITLPLMELFKHTTISQLAYFINSGKSSYEFDEDKAKRMAVNITNLGIIGQRAKRHEEQ